MPTFSYIGRNTKGQRVTGTLSGADENVIVKQLSNQQIIPVSIELNKDKKSSNISDININDLLGLQEIPLDDLIIFCRQMYALMKSGVPILRAINGLSESSNSVKLKKALAEVGSSLEGGFTLSSALNQHKKLFTPLFISLIHVGENTGQLDHAFLKLASYFERELDTRKRIKTALRYPTLVMIFLVAAMVILNIFVIPLFSGLFARLGSDLPITTQILIASSDFFINFWPHMLVVSLASYIGLVQYLKTDNGKYHWDKLKIKLPIVGTVIERSILARFSHSFAIVLKAGVPMTTGLNLVAEAVDNSYMESKIIAMRKSIETGESLLRSAVSSQLFTPLVLQMVAVGEETGRIDELLEEVGDYYEREVDYDLSMLTARIEPIMIVIVAAMVLLLALGIFTPMWNLTSALQGK